MTNIPTEDIEQQERIDPTIVSAQQSTRERVSKVVKGTLDVGFEIAEAGAWAAGRTVRGGVDIAISAVKGVLKQAH